MNTTLNEIRLQRPCKESWEKLLCGLNKSRADNKPLSYSTILKLCGLDDTLWAINCCHPHGPQICAEFALWCAESIHHMLQDSRSIIALYVTRQYLDGDATPEQLRETVIASWAAAHAADLTMTAADTVARTANWMADCAANCAAARRAAWAVHCAADCATTTRRAAWAVPCNANWMAARAAQWTATDAITRKAQNRRLLELEKNMLPPEPRLTKT